MKDEFRMAMVDRFDLVTRMMIETSISIKGGETPRFSLLL